MRLRIAVTCVALCGTFAPNLSAQEVFNTPPPHIALVDGVATLDREDVSEPAVADTPLVPGDRVRTERGRIEVVFPDGSTFDVDEYSSFELQGPTLVRVTSGRVLLTVVGASNPASAFQFQIDTPTASAQTYGPGEYRVALLSGPSGVETELAVLRGSGTLVTEVGSMPLRAGERSLARENSAPSPPQFFNSASFDAFDRWAMARRDERLGSRSAQYLPSDLRPYGGTMDRYGAWQYEASYGYVWYPTVAPGWRPYYAGHWSSVPTYGWTWIGTDTWSWPTHHYGRWGHAGTRWFWIPDRRWSPAWVSWGGAPGYVSWCPLGFDNRPVFALSVSSGHSWSGWTVVSRDHFGGRGRDVRRFAVSPRTLPANTPFITLATAPVSRAHAVPRRGSNGAVSTAAQSAPVESRRFAVGRTAADGRQTTSDRQSGTAASSRSQAAAPLPPSGSRSPRGVSRRPELEAAQSQQPQVAQPGDSPVAGQDRGAFRSSLSETSRSRTQDPSGSAIRTNRGAAGVRAGGAMSPAAPERVGPAAPAVPIRQRYGFAAPRSEPITRPAEVSPESSGSSSGPRRSPFVAPRYERPQGSQATPPPAAAAPAQPAAQQSAPSSGQSTGRQARPRGGDGQSSSTPTSPPAEPQGGQRSRRPR